VKQLLIAAISIMGDSKDYRFYFLRGSIPGCGQCSRLTWAKVTEMIRLRHS
jgi:hypothetical protein